MAIYQIHEEMELATTVEEAWDFISLPENLKEIRPDKIYPGLMIADWVRPILGIKMAWLTEITQVSEPFYFVDEQRAGPSALWHHEHRLSPTERGVLMSDLVTYGLPAGPLGNFAHQIFVQKQVEGIFRYREQVLEQKFDRL